MSGLNKTTGGVVDNYPIQPTQVSNVYDVLTGDLAFDNIGLAKFGNLYAIASGDYGLRNDSGYMQVKNTGGSWSQINGGVTNSQGLVNQIQINDGSSGFTANQYFSFDFTTYELKVGDLTNSDSYISMSDNQGVIELSLAGGFTTVGDYRGNSQGTYILVDDTTGEDIKLQSEGIVYIGDTDWAGYGADTHLEVNDVNQQISCSTVGGVIVNALVTGGNIDVGADADGVLQQTVSDYRLKKNIEPIPNALDKVSKLNGVNFEWKDGNDNGKHIGFIAQEVEKVFPEVVFKKDDYYGINYRMLVSVLIEAVKERQKQIDNLAERLNKFE